MCGLLATILGVLEIQGRVGCLLSRVRSGGLVRSCTWYGVAVRKISRVWRYHSLH